MNWCAANIAGNNANGNSRRCLTSRSVNAATGTSAVPATKSAVIEKHTTEWSHAATAKACVVPLNTEVPAAWDFGPYRGVEEGGLLGSENVSSRQTEVRT